MDINIIPMKVGPVGKTDGAKTAANSTNPTKPFEQFLAGFLSTGDSAPVTESKPGSSDKGAIQLDDPTKEDWDELEGILTAWIQGLQNISTSTNASITVNEKSNSPLDQNSSTSIKNMLQINAEGGTQLAQWLQKLGGSNSMPSAINPNEIMELLAKLQNGMAVGLQSNQVTSINQQNQELNSQTTMEKTGTIEIPQGIIDKLKLLVDLESKVESMLDSKSPSILDKNFVSMLPKASPQVKDQTKTSFVVTNSYQGNEGSVKTSETATTLPVNLTFQGKDQPKSLEAFNVPSNPNQGNVGLTTESSETAAQTKNQANGSVLLDVGIRANSGNVGSTETNETITSSLKDLTNQAKDQSKTTELMNASVNPFQVSEGTAKPSSTPVPVVVPVSQFASEVGDLVNHQIKFTNNVQGVTEAKFSLYPQHLGQVDIRITSHQGQLSAEIITNTLMGKEAIEGQLHQLKDTLQQQGFIVQKLDVTYQVPSTTDSSSTNFMFSGGGNSSTRDQSSSSSTRSNRKGKDQNLEEIEQVNPTTSTYGGTSPGSGSSRIDFSA